MRQIVLDTETTGLEWRNAHRVIEIGCVELLDRKLTGRHYHVYINPERACDPQAVAVHGLTDEFLSDKPRFADLVEGFEAFVADGELVIHNAAFDVGFLDNELKLLGRPTLDSLCAGVVDTLKMAKEQFPGKKASLDALCERFEIDNGQRTLHGALLDAELLADVYLAMTRGQESLMMLLEKESMDLAGEGASVALEDRPPLKVLRANSEEEEAHAVLLVGIRDATKGKCLWLPPEPAEEAAAQ